MYCNFVSTIVLVCAQYIDQTVGPLATLPSWLAHKPKVFVCFNLLFLVFSCNIKTDLN